MNEDEYIKYRREKTRKLFLGDKYYECGCEVSKDGIKYRCWETEDYSDEEHKKHLKQTKIIDEIK